MKCRKCNKVFQPKAYQHKKSNYVCPTCKRIYDKKWREKRKKQGLPYKGTKMPRSYHQKYEKIYYKRSDVKKRRAKQMRGYTKDPLQRPKHQARWVANKALKTGKIKKQPCRICGDLKSEKHHSDYSKPLKVKWYCKKHHPKLKAKAEGK